MRLPTKTTAACAVTTVAPSPKAATEPMPCDWGLAGHHRQKPLRLQLPLEAQRSGAAPEPPPRRFPTIEVVRPQPLRVIPTRRSVLERRHPHRHRTVPLGSQPQVCTRLSFRCVPGDWKWSVGVTVNPS